MRARTAFAWAVTTAMLLGTAGFVLTTSADAAVKYYAANGTVDVRSGPDSSAAVLTTLRSGDVVVASGSASQDWMPISFDGGTAYVSATSLKTTSTTTPVIAGPAGTKSTTAHVNVRASANLTSEIVSVLLKGSTIEVTGLASGDFSQVTLGSATRWMATRYLSATSPSTPTPSPTPTVTPTPTATPTPSPTPTPTATPTPSPTPSLTRVATLDLTMRQTASATSASLGVVKTGAKVTLTGKHEGSYSQITQSGKQYWVLTGYLAPTGEPALALPVAKARNYTNAANVAIRVDAHPQAGILITLPTKGTVLQITGVTKDKYSQVIYDAKTYWVATEYLSATKPATTPTTGSLGSASLDKLQPTAKAAVLVVRDKFPEIKTIHGWRASSAYSSDHPNGRAIDLMIPSYKSNKALGDRIAQYFIDNHKSLKVKYVIWRQRNYTISRGAWVHMADRGSDTQNHYDHVHVSFLS